MAPIQTYDRNPSAQQLGGTTKLSGGDPVSSALQTFGGAVKGAANVFSEFEKAKDGGFTDQSQISRQKTHNLAEQDFHDLQIAEEKTIGDKPEFMRQRMEDWEKGVSSGWKGSPEALEKVVGNHRLRAEQEQYTYQGQVRAFEAETIILSKQQRVDSLVFSPPITDGMTPEMAEATKAEYVAEVEAEFSMLEQLTSPAQAAAHMQQAQEGYFTENFVNLNDTEGLDNALARLEDPETTAGYDYIDEKFLSKAEKANRTRRSYVIQGINEEQRNNLYKAQEDIAAGNYGPVQLEIGKRDGETATSLEEPVGYSPRASRIIENFLQDSIIEQVPAEAMAVRKKAATAISQNAVSYRGKHKVLESLIETEEKFFDKLDNMEGLSSNDKYGMMMDWSNTFKAKANPSLHAVVMDAVIKNWEVEAKLIAAGREGVTMGGGLSSALQQMTGKEDATDMAEVFTKSTSVYNKMHLEVILGEMKTRDTSSRQTQPSQANNGALKWLEDHPLDPRAPAVRQKLGVK